MAPIIYQYYEVKDLLNKMFKCRSCNVVKSGSNVSNLKQHLMHCHKSLYEEFLRETAAAKDSDSSSQRLIPFSKCPPKTVPVSKVRKPPPNVNDKIIFVFRMFPDKVRLQRKVRNWILCIVRIRSS